MKDRLLTVSKASLLLATVTGAAPALGAVLLIPTNCISPAGQNLFNIGESICATGTVSPAMPGIPFIPASGTIYIVPNQDWEPFGGPLEGDVTPGGEISFNAGPSGAFVDLLIWAAPLIPGEYDIVVDDDGNGIFTPGLEYAEGQGPAPGLVIVDPNAPPIPVPTAWVLLVSALVPLVLKRTAPGPARYA